MVSTRPKPLLRGYFHQEAFFTALGACTLLIFKATNSTAAVAGIVYSIGLLSLFGISAFYHRPNWSPAARKRLKCFDHSAIFLLIASTFTPVCLLALPKDIGENLLALVWLLAGIGIAQSFFWISAPRWLTSILYVVLGWMAAPYLGELRTSLGDVNLGLLALGGVFYTVGAVGYAFKFPQLWPRVFGYHELFHVMTIVAAILQFIVVYRLIN